MAVLGERVVDPWRSPTRLSADHADPAVRPGCPVADPSPSLEPIAHADDARAGGVVAPPTTRSAAAARAFPRPWYRGRPPGGRASKGLGNFVGRDRSFRVSARCSTALHPFLHHGHRVPDVAMAITVLRRQCVPSGLGGSRPLGLSFGAGRRARLRRSRPRLPRREFGEPDGVLRRTSRRRRARPERIRPSRPGVAAGETRPGGRERRGLPPASVSHCRRGRAPATARPAMGRWPRCRRRR